VAFKPRSGLRATGSTESTSAFFFVIGRGYNVRVRRKRIEARAPRPKPPLKRVEIEISFSLLNGKNQSNAERYYLSFGYMRDILSHAQLTQRQLVLTSRLRRNDAPMG
jgi:hypothetical protein